MTCLVLSLQYIFIFTINSYLRNKTTREGSTIEGYIIDAYPTFVSCYLDDIETREFRGAQNTRTAVVHFIGIQLCDS